MSVRVVMDVVIFSYGDQDDILIRTRPRVDLLESRTSRKTLILISLHEPYCIRGRVLGLSLGKGISTPIFLTADLGAQQMVNLLWPA